MNLRERALFHQIHPAKLAVDILSEPVSLYLIWRHNLAWGLVAHFLPPIAASAMVMSFANLEGLKASRLGRYVERSMTRAMEAVRLAGDLTMLAGAWTRSPGLIAAGLAIVAAAWLRGRWLTRPRS